MPGKQTWNHCCERDSRLTCPRGITWHLNLCSSTSHSRRQFQLLLAFIKTKLHFHTRLPLPDKYTDLAVPKQLHAHLCNCSQQLQDCIHSLPACVWTPLQQWHTAPSLRVWGGSPGPSALQQGRDPAVWEGDGGKVSQRGGWGWLQPHVQRGRGSHCHPPFHSPSIPLPRSAVTVSLTQTGQGSGMAAGSPPCWCRNTPASPHLPLTEGAAPWPSPQTFNYSGHSRGGWCEV